MRLTPVNPPLNGLRVICSRCGHMSQDAKADLSADPWTFVCAKCERAYEAHIEVERKP